MMWKKTVEAIAALSGAAVSFLCGLPPILWVLLAVMTLDYLTGILCALAGHSPKTAHGGLASGEAFRGLMKKALILLVVLFAYLVDRAVALSAAVEFSAVAGATCLWFMASEGMSILENAAVLGVPIPQILLSALELFKARGDSPDKP